MNPGGRVHRLQLGSLQVRQTRAGADPHCRDRFGPESGLRFRAGVLPAYPGLPRPPRMGRAWVQSGTRRQSGQRATGLKRVDALLPGATLGRPRLRLSLGLPGSARKTFPQAVFAQEKFCLKPGHPQLTLGVTRTAGAVGGPGCCGKSIRRMPTIRPATSSPNLRSAGRLWSRANRRFNLWMRRGPGNPIRPRPVTTLRPACWTTLSTIWPDSPHLA